MGEAIVAARTHNGLTMPTSLPPDNGLQTSWSYDGVDHHVASGSSSTGFSLPYQIRISPSCDLVGNLSSLTFADHTAETINAAYNSLDELTSVSSSISESYSYTPLGSYGDVANLYSKGSASYTYPGATSARPYAPTNVSTIGNFGYDSNGNRSSDPTYTYTYDAENRLLRLVNGANTTVLQNTFDGDGRRLTRVANGVTTHYVGEWYEYDPNAGVATVYYPFNGQPIAMSRGGLLTYLHHDPLGSMVAASNASGGEVCGLRYWPYGGLRSTHFGTGYSALPTDRLFTGQIRDLGNDAVYFFKARYYDATIGRFQVPDAVVPNLRTVPRNPRTVNCYAYGLNNPLRLNDPSGHRTDDPSDPSQTPTLPVGPVWAPMPAPTPVAPHYLKPQQPGLQLDPSTAAQILAVAALATSQYAQGNIVGAAFSLVGGAGTVANNLPAQAIAAVGSAYSTPTGRGVAAAAEAIRVPAGVGEAAGVFVSRAVPVIGAIAGVVGAGVAIDDLRHQYMSVRLAHGNVTAADWAGVGGDGLKILAGVILVGGAITAVAATAPEAAAVTVAGAGIAGALLTVGAAALGR